MVKSTTHRDNFPHRRQRWAAVLVSVTFVLSACGSGGGGDGGGSPPAPVAQPPAISAAPASQAVTAGASAAFSVSASGEAPLRYQWQRNGVDVAGANESSYVLTPVLAADDGSSWRAVVSNAAGSTTSPAASLSVRTIDGTISVFAGGATPGDTHGIGTEARFSYPEGLAFDPGRILYVADRHNHAIRTISPSGQVTTRFSEQGLVGTTPTFIPGALSLDLHGNIYVTDDFYDIRKITPAGVATEFWFGTIKEWPHQMATDASGNVYTILREDGPGCTRPISQGGSPCDTAAIAKYSPSGALTILAGSTTEPGGYVDGNGTAARFLKPRGLASDRAGNVYVADTGNNLLRKVAPDGTVTTVAGSHRLGGVVDGAGPAARFNVLGVMAIDGNDNLYVADFGTIRKVTPAGLVTTVAGTAGSLSGAIDQLPARLPGRLPEVRGMAVDGDGSIFVTGAAFAVLKIDFAK